MEEEKAKHDSKLQNNFGRKIDLTSKPNLGNIGERYGSYDSEGPINGLYEIRKGNRN